MRLAGSPPLLSAAATPAGRSAEATTSAETWVLLALAVLGGYHSVLLLFGTLHCCSVTLSERAAGTPFGTAWTRLRPLQWALLREWNGAPPAPARNLT